MRAQTLSARASCLARASGQQARRGQALGGPASASRSAAGAAASAPACSHAVVVVCGGAASAGAAQTAGRERSRSTGAIGLRAPGASAPRTACARGGPDEAERRIGAAATFFPARIEARKKRRPIARGRSQRARRRARRHAGPPAALPLRREVLLAARNRRGLPAERKAPSAGGAPPFADAPSSARAPAPRTTTKKKGGEEKRHRSAPARAGGATFVTIHLWRASSERPRPPRASSPPPGAGAGPLARLPAAGKREGGSPRRPAACSRARALWRRQREVLGRQHQLSERGRDTASKPGCPAHRWTFFILLRRSSRARSRKILGLEGDRELYARLKLVDAARAEFRHVRAMTACVVLGLDEHLHGVFKTRVFLAHQQHLYLFICLFLCTEVAHCNTEFSSRISGPFIFIFIFIFIYLFVIYLSSAQYVHCTAPVACVCCCCRMRNLRAHNTTAFSFAIFYFLFYCRAAMQFDHPGDADADTRAPEFRARAAGARDRFGEGGREVWGSAREGAEGSGGSRWRRCRRRARASPSVGEDGRGRRARAPSQGVAALAGAAWARRAGCVESPGPVRARSRTRARARARATARVPARASRSRSSSAPGTWHGVLPSVVRVGGDTRPAPRKRVGAPGRGRARARARTRFELKSANPRAR